MYTNEPKNKKDRNDLRAKKQIMDDMGPETDYKYVQGTLLLYSLYRN